MKNEDVSWEVWGTAQLLFTVTNLGASKAQREHLLDYADANYSNSLLFSAVSSNWKLLKEIVFDIHLLSYLFNYQQYLSVLITKRIRNAEEQTVSLLKM